LGLTPRPVREAIQRTYDWYVAHGYLVPRAALCKAA